MVSLDGKTVSLIGYGVSNRSLCNYLVGKGINPVLRCNRECDDAGNFRCIIGNGYLDTEEDVVFRSPSVRRDRIKGKGIISSEAEYSIELADCNKIGVTGSDGKSTVTSLIDRIIKSAGKTSYLTGNIGNPIIEVAEKANKDDFIVAELSSFQLSDFCPSLDCGVITNITPNHLDWHLSMDEYIESKLNILRNSKVKVLNLDCDILNRYIDSKTRVFTLSGVDKSPFRNTVVYMENGYICIDGERIIHRDGILLKGDFNILNVECAIAATVDYADKKSIVYALESFDGIQGRMQTVGIKDGITFVNSSIDSTPSRTSATVSAFPLSKTVIILGGYDKNLDYGILEKSLDGIKAIVICGENREKIYSAVRNTTGELYIESTFEDCVNRAKRIAKSGDYVLLSPASASFDMFRNYKERAERFISLI